MAQNLVVNFIGENKLSKTTAAISADLRKFGSVAKTIGNSVNKAIGVAGIGLGFAQLARTLKQSTKAAVEDNKSQALLANALRNTVNATSGAIAGAEKFIAKTQLQTSVLDDNLRPALATAVRATGSLAKGQKLLNTALNVSAGTGKDLGTVTNAISKAFNGNTASLKKLLPSIKTGGDFMAQLDTQFQGAAATAANADPYQRFQVILADIQETIGQSLIPALEEFSKYLVSTEGQRNIKQIVGLFVQAGKAITEVTRFVIQNIAAIKALVAAVITLKAGWILITGAVKAYEIAVKLAAISTKALKVALITTGVGALVVALGTLISALSEAETAQKSFRTAVTAEDLRGVGDYWDFQAKKAREAFGKSWVARGAAEAKRNIKKVATTIKTGISDGAKEIAKTGETFRDSIGLAFGTFGKDENTVFNADVVIAKLKRIVNAAKGFKENIAKLTKAGAGRDVINEIIGMGPAQGNIVAKGLLQSGKLSEYLGLRGSLYKTGTDVAGVATQEKTYTININKAKVSAEDIIAAVRSYEKKTARKYFAN
jgi:hypothetical protein